MTRPRPTALLCSISLALFAILAAHGYGQTPAGPSKTLVGMFAPRPVQRGISPVTTMEPGSREMRRSRRIRRINGQADRAGRSGGRYVPGKVIVKFRDGVAQADRLSAMSTVSRTARFQARPTYQDFDIVQIDPSEDAEAGAQALSRRADVEYAQPAYRVYPTLVPNDSFFPAQWNLSTIEMPVAWDLQPAAGSQIVVAVLDTGMAFANVTLTYHASAFAIDDEDNVGPPGFSGSTTYPALGTLTLQFVRATELGGDSRFVAPHDFIWDDNLPVDLDGHGTHVSGTIGQLTNNRTNGQGDTANAGGTAGVAFNVRLMPVKVLNTVWDDVFGSPNVGTDDVVARGIRYAADNGANIINMSFAREGPIGSAPVVEDAVKYAVARGVLVVVSGGNDFENGNPPQVFPEIASRVQGAVSVAAIDRRIEGQTGARRCLGTASSPDCHAPYSSTGTFVELSAPGGSFSSGSGALGGIVQQTLDFDFVRTFDQPPSRFTAPRFDVLAYFYITGTSSAAPHVSGVAAMLMQQGIKSPAAIEAALERVAIDLGAEGRDSTYGFGLVDARNSLRGLGLAR